MVRMDPWVRLDPRKDRPFSKNKSLCKDWDGPLLKGGPLGEDESFGKEGPVGKDGTFGEDTPFSKHGPLLRDVTFGKDGPFGKDESFGKTCKD